MKCFYLVFNNVEKLSAQKLPGAVLGKEYH